MNDLKENNRPTLLSATDRADTGLWHLLVSIRHDGMQAWLKSKTDSQMLPECILNVDWDESDEKLLENIETAVYDTPGLLDDYSTDIVINTSETLWVPTPLLDNFDEETFFEPFFNTGQSDIFSSEHDEQTCLFSFTKGLRSFLSRTFSGSRINCQLAIFFNHFCKRAVEDPHIFLVLSKKQCNFIGIESGKILFSSSRKISNPEEILYHVVNAAAAYNLKHDDIRICPAGESQLKNDAVKLLRTYFKHVHPANVPSASRIGEMPLELALCSLKNISISE